MVGQSLIWPDRGLWVFVGQVDTRAGVPSWCDFFPKRQNSRGREFQQSHQQEAVGCCTFKGRIRGSDSRVQDNKIQNIWIHTTKNKHQLACKLKTVLCYAQLFSPVQLFETPRAVACQAPLSMGFPRQNMSGLPFLSPTDLLDPGIEPTSSALVGGFFTSEPPRKPKSKIRIC